MSSFRWYILTIFRGKKRQLSSSSLKTLRRFLDSLAQQQPGCSTHHNTAANRSSSSCTVARRSYYDSPCGSSLSSSCDDHQLLPTVSPIPSTRRIGNNHARPGLQKVAQAPSPKFDPALYPRNSDRCETSLSDNARIGNGQNSRKPTQPTPPSRPYLFQQISQQKKSRQVDFRSAFINTHTYRPRQLFRQTKI